MSRRVFFFLALLYLPLLAHAQQAEPTVYTNVVLWTIPRAQWDEFVAFGEKNARPIFERRMADGTLVAWGTFATVVHTEDGYTHGSWYSATSVAALERVRDELIKLPPNPAILAATRHRDHLLSSLSRKTRLASGSGYLDVSLVHVKPGKGEEWRELWDKYIKPEADGLLANGTITYYEIQDEDVHTEDPGLRFEVIIYPSAEARDQADAAFFQKLSQEEIETIRAAFREVTVPGAHRDYFARIANYALK